jgi:Domain of Unknown Function (DUF928)
MKNVMPFVKSLLLLIPVAIVLALELAIASSTASPALSQSFLVSRIKQAGRKQSNPPPPPTNPGSSSAGGRRDPSACPQDAVTAETVTAETAPLLTALSPTPAPGLTLAERPTFLIYVPGTSAKSAEFSLRDREGRGVYRTTVDLTQALGLVSVSLPEQIAPLEVGKQYTWAFAIICNPDDRIEDRFVTGSVQRAELDPTRLRQIEQSPPRQRLVLYQENGIWYDALALLWELKHNPSNDPNLSTVWRELLQSGGVDPLIDINSDK